MLVDRGSRRRTDGRLLPHSQNLSSYDFRDRLTTRYVTPPSLIASSGKRVAIPVSRWIPRVPSPANAKLVYGLFDSEGTFAPQRLSTPANRHTTQRLCPLVHMNELHLPKIWRYSDASMRLSPTFIPLITATPKGGRRTVLVSLPYQVARLPRHSVRRNYPN